MSNRHHRALVVEDEAEAAADLVEVLQTCGCESVVVTNRHDALIQLRSTEFCLIVLDLQIGSEPDSIRGRVENGKAVLADARRRFPARTDATHALPIIVVSGFARETEAAVEAMREGASDVVQKLSTPQEKVDRIVAVLERSGRTSHGRCDELSRAAIGSLPPRELTLSIPADRDGRRFVVMLGARSTALPVASLKVLLHLVKARLSTGFVHKIDLGGSADRGFKAISVLRNELKPAYSGDLKTLIANDYQGGYRLADDVSVGAVNVEVLEALGDKEIAKLAREIRSLLNGKAKSDGNS